MFGVGNEREFDSRVIYRTFVAIVLMQIVSYSSVLPVWLIVNVVLVAGFVVFYMRPASGFFRFLYTIASVSVFGLYYRLGFTVEMAAAFLMMSASLKLLELKVRRDVYLYVFVMLYLSSVSFLFEQRFLHTILQVLVILACFSVLLNLNGGGGLSALSHQWKSLLKLMGLALPLVIVCFLFFPRIAPLWSIPVKTQNAATTGMSDTMSPGDIAELSQSSERAFRVEFSGARPSQRDLYWRGLILDKFDGSEWRRGAYRFVGASPKKVDLGSLYNTAGDSYEVMMEPHLDRWVYALEGSSVASSNVLKGEMDLFSLKTDAIQATRYKMEYSYESDLSLLNRLPTGRLLKGKFRQKTHYNSDLQIPRGTNPRTHTYIRRLVEAYPDKIDLAGYLLAQFSQQEFFYTLKPPLIGRNFVDEFLFDTKRGFCEHYSSSFAFMLRLADIPARVVLGYQGGELNPNGDYLIVHQYDAHAWVEAYFDELGWVRLDPTAMVAPQRIIRNLEEAVREEGTFLEGSPMSSAALSISALNWMRLRMDEMNFQWQKWVVNYGESQQYSILKNLFGEYSLARIIWLFVGLFAVLSFGIIWYLWRISVYKHYTQAQRRYFRWLRVLSRFGYVREKGESPSAFLQRTEAEMHPRLARITKKKTIQLEQSDYQ